MANRSLTRSILLTAALATAIYTPLAHGASEEKLTSILSDFFGFSSPASRAKKQEPQQKISEISADPSVFFKNEGPGTAYPLDNSEPNKPKFLQIDPDIAYDTDNHRYLKVWTQRAVDKNGNLLDATQIVGQLLEPSGKPIGNQITISDAVRETEGCFDKNFSKRIAAGVKIPTDCPTVNSPAVAYNQKRFMVVWELSGKAEQAYDRNINDPFEVTENKIGKEFSNIIGKMIDAQTLKPINGWEEGRSISPQRVAYSYNPNIVTNPQSCPAFVTEDQIQAWSRATRPDIAPSADSNSFAVTWETNRDFFTCVDPVLRKAKSIQATSVDENYQLPDSCKSTEDGIVQVVHDPSAEEKLCSPLNEVFTAKNPRIAYNASQKQFAVAYELMPAANGTTEAGIGVKGLKKKGTGNTLSLVDVNSSATVVKTEESKLIEKNTSSKAYHHPDIASFGSDFIIAYNDAENGAHNNNVIAQNLTSSKKYLVNDNNKEQGVITAPRLSTTTGVWGNCAGLSCAPDSTKDESILVSYIYRESSSGNTSIKAVLLNYLDNQFNLLTFPENANSTLPYEVSDLSVSTDNRGMEWASNSTHFYGVWQGTSGILERNIVVKNEIPTAPVLATDPADGVTWAPTRLYLSWNPASDKDGDALVYDLYFVEDPTMTGAIPANTPAYKSGLTETNFIIQASTDGRTQYLPDGCANQSSCTKAIYLEPNQHYLWKVCARDVVNASNCSETRKFNTDDSVVGWWRFDEDPNGADCPAILGGPVGDAGETVCDYSGKGNHGVPHGGVSWLNMGTDLLGQALNFDGVDGWVVVPYQPLLSPNSLGILASIVHQNGGSMEQQIIDQRSGTGMGAGFDLRIFNDSQLQFIVSDLSENEKYLSFQENITEGSRFVVNANYDDLNKQMTASLNMQSGNILNVSTPFDRSIKSTNSITLANVAFSVIPTPYKGIIDEVLLTNKASTNAEISNASSICNF